MLGFSRSDVASLGESIQGAITKGITDTSSLGESAASALGFSRSDGAAVADSVKSAIGKGITDSGGVGESIQGAVTKGITDTSSLGESAASALGFSRSDGAALADSVKSAIGKGITDSGGIGESIGAVIGFSRSDGATLVESMDSLLGKSFGDTAKFGDSIATALGFSRSDSASLGESIQATMSKGPSEVANLVESVLLGLASQERARLGESMRSGVSKGVTDRSGLRESFAVAVGFSRADGGRLTAAVQSAMGKRFGDTGSVGESVRTGVSKVITDAASLRDAVAVALGFSSADGARLATSASTAIGKGVGDAGSVGESIAVALGFPRSDGARLADSVRSVAGKGFGDTGGLGESIATALGLSRTQGAQLGESIETALGVPRADGATLVASIRSAVSRAFSGDAGLADSITAVVGFPRTDGASLVESVALAVQFGRTDLQVAYAGASDLVLAGSPLEYAVIVTNNGPTSATGVVLLDTLPPPEQAVFGSATSSQGSCSHVSRTVTCALEDIARGESATVNIRVIPSPAAIGSTIDNIASVTSNVTDVDDANNSASQSTGVLPSADLVLSSSDAPDPVQLGQVVTLTLGVTNAGPSVATGTVLVARLSEHTIFRSATTSVGDCTHVSGTVTCELGDLPSGASAAANITVEPTEGGAGTSIINPSSVSSTVSDPNVSNNSASAETLVNTASRADLSVTVEGAPESMPIGGSLTYAITIRSTGPAGATKVVMVDTPPADARIDSMESSQGSCSGVDGSPAIRCELGDIANGGAATVNITITPTEAAGGTSITNTVSVGSRETDPDSSNNVAVQLTAVIALADLKVTKIDSPDPVLVGNTVTYSVEVTNNGPSPAIGVIATDTLPSNVAFGSASPSQGSCDHASGTVTCALGTIASGGTATVTIEVAPTVEAGGGTITNTASVASEVTDPDISNNSASQTTTVPKKADLAVTK